MFVVAHRGASGTEPENTLRAFKKAVDLGVDFIECDVHLSLDGEIIVIHDDTVSRTTNGEGKVSEMTLKEIKSLDAGKGERIPTLSEVLDLIRSKVKAIVELKAEKTPFPVVRCVESLGMIDDVVISSFNFDLLKDVRRLSPHLRISPLPGDLSKEVINKVSSLGAWGISVSASSLTSDLVKLAHSRGILLRTNIDPRPDLGDAWLFKEIKRMHEIGLDGIATDYPEEILKILRDLEN